MVRAQWPLWGRREKGRGRKEKGKGEGEGFGDEEIDDLAYDNPLAMTTRTIKVTV